MYAEFFQLPHPPNICCRVPCLSCSFIYLRETSQWWEKRESQHKRSVKNRDENNSFYIHLKGNPDHVIGWEQVSFLLRFSLHYFWNNLARCDFFVPDIFVFRKNSKKFGVSPENTTFCRRLRYFLTSCGGRMLHEAPLYRGYPRNASPRRKTSKNIGDFPEIFRPLTNMGFNGRNIGEFPEIFSEV